MNILENTDHSVKKQHIEYLVQLIRIALADDIITNSEMELLHRMGKKLGLKDYTKDQSFSDAEAANVVAISMSVWLNVCWWGARATTSVPRSGSTWLMELIWSQPGFLEKSYLVFWSLVR